MTVYGDNIYSGNLVGTLTSATTPASEVTLTRTHRLNTGVTQTQTGVFPQGAMNLDSVLYILANASSTVSDKITVSAAGTTLLTWSSFGSSQGIARQTTTSLATYTPIASACAVLTGAASTDLSYSVTTAQGTDSTGSDYQLQLRFSRKNTLFD